ncbi:hypothetical protein BGLA2_380006 [Burkholderia gladioli]|nr:hypothetical protein BGLA2_380006 [Burkholderia gladioli]
MRATTRQTTTPAARPARRPEASRARTRPSFSYVDDPVSDPSDIRRRLISVKRRREYREPAAKTEFTLNNPARPYRGPDA